MALSVALLLTACAEPAELHHSPSSYSPLAPVLGDFDHDSLATAAKLELHQVFRIGGQDSDAYTFVRVGNVDVSKDGAIVVLDVGRAEVAVFDSTGKLLRSFGRSGKGPGELTYALVSAMTVGEDTVFVLDGNRVHAFSILGDLHYTQAVEGVRDSYSVVRSLSHSSTGLVVGRHTMRSSTGHKEGRSTQQDTILISQRRNATGLFDTDGKWTLPGPQWFDQGPLRFHRLYAGTPQFGITADGFIVYTTGENYIVNVYTTAGSPVGRIEGAPQRHTVTDAEAREALSRQRAFMRQTAGPDAIQIVRDFDQFVKSVPASEYRHTLGRIIGGDGGWILVERRDLAPVSLVESTAHDAAPTFWDVINIEGKLGGRVSVSSGFRPVVLRGGLLIGTARDADDVQTVVGYRLCCLSP